MADDASATALVSRHLVTAGEELLRDPRLAALYWGDWLAEEWLKDLVEMDPDYQHRQFLARLDGAETPDGLCFYEYNCETPQGWVECDSLSRLFDKTDVLAEFAKTHSIRWMNTAASIADALMAAWKHFSGSATQPRIVFALPDVLLQDPGTVLAVGRMTAALAKRGLDIESVSLSQFRKHLGNLFAGERKVDVIIRGVLTEMVPALTRELDLILAAARAGDVLIANSFRAAAYGNKGLFAYVTDPASGFTCSGPDRLALDRHLPWTRVFRDADTTDWNGNAINVSKFARARQRELVVKDATGNSGTAVYLGWMCEPAEWERHLGQALESGNWILQRRTVARRLEFPTLAPSTSSAFFTGDRNPIVTAGVLGGYTTRLTTTQNTSVPDGGQIPTLIVSDHVQ